MSRPILQVVGYKNSGKTTVVTTMLHVLTGQQLNVATIKHDAHDFQFDQSGTDTWKHTQAGSALTLIQSPHHIGVIAKQNNELELSKLIEIVSMIGHYDMLLIEGYKREAFPKVVVIRTREDFDLLDLANIQLVLFWQEADQDHYTDECRRGAFSTYSSLSIRDEEAVKKWILQYLSK